MSKNLKTLKDGMKVSDVMIILRFEDDTSCIARPTNIGEIEGCKSLNDLLKLLSHGGDEKLPKFQSPIVFAEDLRQAAREWIKHYEHLMEIEEDREMYNFYAGERAAYVEFFNLEDKC